MKQRCKMCESTIRVPVAFYLSMNNILNLVPFEKISGMGEPENIRLNLVFLSDSGQVPWNSGMIFGKCSNFPKDLGFPINSG